MAFPEISTWTSNFSTFIHTLGIGLFLAVLGIVGLIFMTGFGSERRAMLAKAAAVMALIGLGFIIGAPVIQTILTRVFGG